MQRFVHLYPHSASLATSRAVIATFAAFLTVFEVAFTSTQGPLKQFLSQFPIGGLTSPGYHASFSCGLGSYQRSSTCAFALFQRLTLYGCAEACYTFVVAHVHNLQSVFIVHQLCLKVLFGRRR